MISTVSRLTVLDVEVERGVMLWNTPQARVVIATRACHLPGEGIIMQQRTSDL